MSFQQVIARHFPGSSEQTAFVRRAAVTLIQDYGFSPSNSLACLGQCRDELCRSLSEEVEAMWGEAFDFSSLAGILTIGTTGFAAARAHAPIVGGRCHYLFFLFAHIGIGPDGELGVALRPGQSAPSSACGALVALLDNWGSKDHGLTRVDWQDPELSLLRMRVRRIKGLSEEPDLIELTKAIHLATLQDLQVLVEAAFELDKEDLAVVAGVQIHAPDGSTLIWPGASYVVVNGVRSEIWI